MKRLLNDKLLWLCFLLLIVSVTVFASSSLSSISVFALTMLMLLIYVYFHNWKIHFQITKYHMMVAAFAFFCVCTAAWAQDNKSAIEVGITIFEILICMTAICCCFQEQNTVRGMLTALMWNGPILALYMLYFYGPSVVVKMILGNIRINDEFANANTIGIWATISAILFYYFILHDGWKWKYCAITLPIALVALSQSRKAVLALVLGVITVQLFKNGFQKTGLKGFVKLILGLAVVIIGLIWLSKTQLFAGMMKRMLSGLDTLNGTGQDGSVNLRKTFIQAGLAQFLKTPLLGIGFGNSYLLTREVSNSSTYLHNNFVELLACGGIVGFCLYYRIVVFLGTRLWRYRMVPHSDICFVILLVYVFLEIGVVSYYKKQTYLLFLVCFLQTVFAERDFLRENKLMDTKNCVGE